MTTDEQKQIMNRVESLGYRLALEHEQRLIDLINDISLPPVSKDEAKHERHTNR